MKIRTQINVLMTLVIAIPVLCVIYFPIYHYFTSPNRLLIDGTKNIPQIESTLLTEQDQNELRSVLRDFPPDVQVAIFTNTFDVIETNIPELVGIEKLGYDSFWSFAEDTREAFFYQFSTMETDHSSFVILTRIPRRKDIRAKKNKAGIWLYILLFVIVSLCVITIIFTTRNIFLSINLIERQTQAIAGGNLNIKINTDKKKKNEITSIADSLEKMRFSLEDAQTRRNKFIMGISHDLRTPVAIIRGYTEAIADGMVPENEMNNTLNLICAKTSQLENMINTLINFMKLDTTDWRENLKEESITKSIRDFAHDACLMGPLFKRVITSDIDFPNEIFVPMDIQLVTRVFENILNNAIRYTQENDTISIYGRETENEIIMTISDTGEGMTEEDLNHIFDLFYRGTASRREEGMGIGLSVVKSVITTLEWDIDVHSELGKGSEFIISIPKKCKFHKCSNNS
ncbi:MAG: HAMP domain-containing histidine kinase [Treponema sp.]|nr:HAMP domain-containing histidine kinase [Treponema sp.]